MKKGPGVGMALAEKAMKQGIEMWRDVLTITCSMFLPYDTLSIFLTLAVTIPWL